MSEKKLTPMMQQYLDIKNKHQEEIVMFRMGDFYEMFMDDAIKVSKILQLALAKRGDVPMCGIPHHASNNYFYKLINAGQKIAVAEQIEKPGIGKTLLKRDVVQIITPGTVIDQNSLEENKNNYLIQLNLKADDIYIAAVDISTGQIECSLFQEGSIDLSISAIISHYEPKEIILPENSDAKLIELMQQWKHCIVNEVPTYIMQIGHSSDLLKKIFSVSTLKSLGLEDHPEFIPVLGGVIHYLKQNHMSNLEHLQIPKIINRNQTMRLDHSTINNLELIRNSQDNSEDNSLFKAINHTRTPMGSRLLRNLILKPHLDLNKIIDNQNKVKVLIDNSHLFSELLDGLNSIYDFERLLSKLALNKINPKELLNLKNSLKEFCQLNLSIKKTPSILIAFEDIESIQYISQLITDTLLDEPNINLNEGGVIRENVDPVLDKLRKANSEGMNWIMDLLKKEKNNSGISNLKIKYTDNSGYFFEVTKSQLNNIPSHFVKKQTMVNAGRYTTAELLQYQEEILSAKEKSIELEQKIYGELKEKIKTTIQILQSASTFCAEIDVWVSYASVALRYNYCRPEITLEKSISITDGRHPVMEQIQQVEFIPNDLVFDGNELVQVITGPNMGGKSTFLRQNALIVLLAQMGCYVPATKARIGICDRIFTRIGASDNLIKGESTFLSEMSETAYILSQASPNSLIIMDEIGRGTSTYDGLSLAWSIIEFIIGQSGPNSNTLFATHYHELTELEKYPQVTNYHVSIIDNNKSLVFTKKVTPGAADKSYGIHVAELAGLPKEVIRFAENKLKELENTSPSNQKMLPPSIIQTEQISLFEQPSLIERTITKAIKEFDLNNSTPIEGFNLLGELKHKLDELGAP